MENINKSKNVKKLILIHVQNIYFRETPYEKDQQIDKYKNLF